MLDTRKQGKTGAIFPGSSYPVYGFQKFLNFKMGVDGFRYRLPFVAGNFLNDLIINLGHGHYTNASVLSCGRPECPAESKYAPESSNQPY